MQRIKLVDGTFVENVQEINDYVERYNLDDRKVLNITVTNTSFDAMFNAFSNPQNLTSLEIQDQDADGNYITQGLQMNYTILSFIKGIIAGNTFTVQLHQKSNIEQQLLEAQLALAELGSIIGGML
jgi:hypothetical protein